MLVFLTRDEAERELDLLPFRTRYEAERELGLLVFLGPCGAECELDLLVAQAMPAKPRGSGSRTRRQWMTGLSEPSKKSANITRVANYSGPIVMAVSLPDFGSDSGSCRALHACWFFSVGMKLSVS